MRLRGLRGTLRARRRAFVSDVVSELACAEKVDFMVFDIARAEAARQRAEEHLKRYSDLSVDRERARQALAKAIARLETARRAKG